MVDYCITSDTYCDSCLRTMSLGDICYNEDGGSMILDDEIDFIQEYIHNECFCSEECIHTNYIKNSLEDLKCEISMRVNKYSVLLEELSTLADETPDPWMEQILEVVRKSKLNVED